MSTDLVADPSRPQPKLVLTVFLAEELMLSYVLGDLDPLRKQAFEEALKRFPELHIQKASIEAALGHCERIAAIEFPKDLISQVHHSQGRWNRIKKSWRWTELSDATRWGIEATAVAIISILAGVFSWPFLDQWLMTSGTTSSVMIAEVDRAQVKRSIVVDRELGELPEPSTPIPDLDKMNPATASGAAGLNPSIGATEGEEVGESPAQREDLKHLAAAQRGQSVTVSTSSSPSKESLVPPGKELSGASGKSLPNSVSLKAKSESVSASMDKSSLSIGRREEALEGDSDLGAANAQKSPALGVVYRAVMTMPAISETSQEIKDELERLGAERAGQVPLGWKKTNGSYFHFTLPVSNYDSLVRLLSRYGQVRMTKDSHPRLMPDGLIRVILWIEDTGKNQ